MQACLNFFQIQSLFSRFVGIISVLFFLYNILFCPLFIWICQVEYLIVNIIYIVPAEIKNNLLFKYTSC